MTKKVIISRTDGIGDVVLTLPAIGMVKKINPGIKVLFLGRSYTEPVIAACQYIDEFINRDELLKLTENEQIAFLKQLEADAIVHVYPDREIAKLAFKSKIPLRIGTSHRFHHWLYCNRLLPVGRKRSVLHEAQLNALLFRHFGIDAVPSLETLASLISLTRTVELDDKLAKLLDPDRFNLILHPCSKGSAREWGLANFGELIRILPKERCKIFISGSSEDSELLQPLLQLHRDIVTDISGKISLPQFISFINQADGLVAASTGPLHIAAALGKVAVGLYAPMKPIHPGRWAPLGINADYSVLDRVCEDCRHESRCKCIESIKPEDVAIKLGKLSDKKRVL